MSQAKFVSSIPKNKLEPVFLGGGSGPSSKSSGAYVPVFLRSEESQEKPNKKDVKQNEFKMNDTDFPSFLGVKATNSTGNFNTFTNYSNALKKDIDKPRPKVSTSKGSSEKNIKKKQSSRILDCSKYDSDGYSDTYNSDDGF